MRPLPDKVYTGLHRSTRFWAKSAPKDRFQELVEMARAIFCGEPVSKPEPESAPPSVEDQAPVKQDPLADPPTNQTTLDFINQEPF